MPRRGTVGLDVQMGTDRNQVATARPGSSVANQIIAADRPADRVGNVLDDRRRHISQGVK